MIFIFVHTEHSTCRDRNGSLQSNQCPGGGADPNTSCSVLGYAVVSNDIDTVETLLSARTIKVNYGDNQISPLYVATRKGNLDIAKMLLSKEADPDQRSGPNAWTPLMAAIMKGNCKMADLLLEYGASADLKSGEHDTPPLVEAAFRGNWDMCCLLMKYGANPAATNIKGE